MPRVDDDPYGSKHGAFYEGRCIIINDLCVAYNYLYCVVFGIQCDLFSKDGINFILYLTPLNLLLEYTRSVLLDVGEGQINDNVVFMVTVVTIKPVTGLTATQICTLTHLMNVSC
jgi:hypothetical protein